MLNFMHFISNIMLLLHFNFISIFPQQIKIYFFFLVRTGFSERFFIPLGSYLSRVFNPKSVVQIINEMKEKFDYVLYWATSFSRRCPICFMPFSVTTNSLSDRKRKRVDGTFISISAFNLQM